MSATAHLRAHWGSRPIHAVLACLLGGVLWIPWRLWAGLRNARRAACRAVAFHNLAIFATQDFQGFSEERFWDDVERFLRDFPEADWCNYRGMFEASLRGETLHVIEPGGGAPAAASR